MASAGGHAEASACPAGSDWMTKSPPPSVENPSNPSSSRTQKNDLRGGDDSAFAPQRDSDAVQTFVDRPYPRCVEPVTFSAFSEVAAAAQ